MDEIARYPKGDAYPNNERHSWAARDSRYRSDRGAAGNADTYVSRNHVNTCHFRFQQCRACAHARDKFLARSGANNNKRCRKVHFYTL